MPVRWVTLVLPLTAAGALTACGGSRKPLPQAQLVTRADAICRSFRTDIRALPAPTGYGGIARLAEDTKTKLNDELGKLKDLTPPARLSDDYRAYLDAVDSQQDTLDAIVSAARKHDDDKITTITAKARKAARGGGQHAKAVGLKVCGQED